MVLAVVMVVVACPGVANRHNHTYAFRYSVSCHRRPPSAAPRDATRTSLYAACINYNVALHGRVARAKEIGFPARPVKRNYASTTSAENVTGDYEARRANHTRNNR